MCIKIYSIFNAVITETIIVGTSVNYVLTNIIMVCNVIALELKTTLFFSKINKLKIKILKLKLKRLCILKIGINLSGPPKAGNGASTVNTPSLLRDDLIASGLFVVDCFDDDFLGFVLTDVESEFQHFVVAILLNQRRIDAFNPTARRSPKVRLFVHEFGTKLGHLVFHFSHFSVKTLADVAEFRVDHTEVAQLDRDVSLDASVVCHLYFSVCKENNR
ncbi:hypothetical protein AGLY_000193 [Aphis glycines]|uniref:Uncharacterized protein n=1 Tax=Aphis glycines TaxID=307491 RepID=A0A6G0U6A1_APHGL|nr:hypothetical protein AGLY_000193 [Aphis glycines]